MNATMDEMIIMTNPLVTLYRSARNLKTNVIVDEMFLFRGGVWPLVSILSSYLIFAIVIGPKMMANRKPYDLRGVITVYNIFMVALNIYFFFESLYAYEFGRSLMNFQFPDSQHRDITVAEMRRLTFVYWYFVSKLVDLLDTIFFILRKKWTQVSPLHLYHHASVPVCVWLAVKFAPTAGVNGIFPIFNSAVHVLMYTYYALSAFGPIVQPYLWWKRYITQVQLIQFVIFFIYGTTYVFKQTGWPTILICTSVAQPPVYLVLFSSFYLKTYCESATNKVISGAKYQLKLTTSAHTDKTQSQIITKLKYN
ncbi:elongation of very long chain fatty acids protein 1-like [Oppia nitens]|uniref:elongation of very long chain fatty acids protein 1-like n=1 Tax=Oppia nitens TaxID=1686743 RepID=UPI0023DBFDD8|nr:elongation of very long chain fatty acids protein 1-like [Oppia nitens]